MTILCAALLAFPAPLLQTAPLQQAEPPEEPGSSAEEARGLRLNAPGASQGYTLFSPLGSAFTFLVDMQGREVQRWKSEHGPSSVYLLEDGSILRTARLKDNPVFKGGGIYGRIERISWDGELLWHWDLFDEYQTLHHDVQALPNGNILLISWEFRYREDCLAVGRAPASTSEKGLWPDAVLEIEPLGEDDAEIVWEWHVWDHLIQDLDPQAESYGSIPEHPERLDINYDHRDSAPISEEQRRKREEILEQMRALGYTGGDEDDGGDEGDEDGGDDSSTSRSGHAPDWLHTNAIDYSPELDLIALSSPHMNEVWIIDHSTSSEEAAGDSGGRHGKGGGILWRWGNPRNHGAGTRADQRLFYQHNVHWIPKGLPGAGHLLMFNNGQERPGGDHSTVLELALPLQPDGAFLPSQGANGPAEPHWVYGQQESERFYAAFISGCQRLPNGNTLICAGPEGRVFEVTPEGEMVWDFLSPYGGDLEVDGVDGRALFRATRVAPQHPGLAGRVLEPSGPEHAKPEHAKH